MTINPAQRTVFQPVVRFPPSWQAWHVSAQRLYQQPLSRRQSRRLRIALRFCAVSRAGLARPSSHPLCGPDDAADDVDFLGVALVGLALGVDRLDHHLGRLRVRATAAGSVSLLGYVQFPVQSAKFPVPILREFGEKALNLFANGRASSPSPASSGKNSLYFPAKQGIRRGDRFADDCLHRQFSLVNLTLVR